MSSTFCRIWPPGLDERGSLHRVRSDHDVPVRTSGNLQVGGELPSLLGHEAVLRSPSVP